MFSRTRRRRSRASLVAVLFVAGGLGACSSQATDESFGSGARAFHASTVDYGDHKVTTVVDHEDAEVLVMTLNRTTVSLAFADGTASQHVEFPEPLERLPDDATMNRMAVVVADSLDKGAPGKEDTPGCNFFPDVECSLGCCAQHDRCYRDHGCRGTSWLSFFHTDECDACNREVLWCVTQTCTGDLEPATDNRCYDARCGEYFDCGEASCDCESPCGPR